MVIVIYFEVQQTVRKGDIVLIIKAQILHVAFVSQKDKHKCIITINDNFVLMAQKCHGKSCIQQEKDSFYQQTGLKFEEETNKMLHVEHGFVWCRNLVTSGSRSQISGKFRNVVLQKDGEEHLDRSCEK